MVKEKPAKQSSEPVVSWPALDAYFASNPYFITKHHLESYDDFMDRIPAMIKTLNPFTIFKPYPKPTTATGAPAGAPDDTQPMKHEIHIYIGGENADRIRFQPTDPELRPNEARIYNKTYSTDVIVDVDIKFVYNPHPKDAHDKNNKKVDTTKRITDVKLATIPTMLHSKQCMLLSLIHI